MKNLGTTYDAYLCSRGMFGHSRWMRWGGMDADGTLRFCLAFTKKWERVKGVKVRIVKTTREVLETGSKPMKKKA